MRGIIFLALALAGCSREPTFDERYAATQQKLSEKSAAIDRELGAAKGPSANGTEQPPHNPAD